MHRNLTHDPVGTFRRRRALIVLSLMAALLLPVAIAWACGPNRQMQCDRMSYSPGGQVSCSGVNFYENMQLSFRLDNGGPVGSVTTTSEGTFTFSFAAPADPGAYTLVAEGFDENGNPRPGLPARQSFEVAAPAPPQQAPDASPQTPTPAPGAAPAPGARNPAPRSNSPTRQERGGTNRGSDQGRSRAESPAADGNGGRRDPSRTGQGGGAPSGGLINPNEGVIESVGQEVFAGSVSREDRASTPAGGNLPSTSPSPSKSNGSAPAEASASGDLWSGFGSSANPSLVPGANDALGPEADATPGVTWGLALLGLGLLVLMATLGVAEARRRRALTR